MVRRCVVGGCSTTSGIDKDITQFGWPKDEHFGQKWIKFVKSTRKDDPSIATAHASMCCLHFTTDSFMNYMAWKQGFGRLQLLCTAVPTIKDPRHNQLGLTCKSNEKMGEFYLVDTLLKYGTCRP